MQLHVEAVLTRLPAGSRDLIGRVCARHRIKQSEFMRLAVLRALEAEGLSLPDLAKRRLNLCETGR